MCSFGAPLVSACVVGLFFFSCGERGKIFARYPLLSGPVGTDIHVCEILDSTETVSKR